LLTEEKNLSFGTKYCQKLKVKIQILSFKAGGMTEKFVFLKMMKKQATPPALNSFQTL